MLFPWYALSWKPPVRTGVTVTVYNPTNEPRRVTLLSSDGGRFTATDPELVVAEECQASAQLVQAANEEP